MAEAAALNYSVADAPYATSATLLAAAPWEGSVFVRMRRDARAWAESRQLHHGEGILCHPSLWKESGLASPLDMHSCARACVKAAGKAAARVRTSRDCFSALSEVSVQQLA